MKINEATIKQKVAVKLRRGSNRKPFGPRRQRWPHINALAKQASASISIETFIFSSLTGQEVAVSTPTCFAATLSLAGRWAVVLAGAGELFVQAVRVSASSLVGWFYFTGHIYHQQQVPSRSQAKRIASRRDGNGSRRMLYSLGYEMNFPELLW